VVEMVMIQHKSPADGDEISSQRFLSACLEGDILDMSLILMNDLLASQQPVCQLNNWRNFDYK
jgi:hypothetical protein